MIHVVVVRARVLVALTEVVPHGCAKAPGSHFILRGGNVGVIRVGRRVVTAAFCPLFFTSHGSTNSPSWLRLDGLAEDRGVLAGSWY